MSREIKFRAFNGIDKTMISWGTIKAFSSVLINLINGQVKHHTLMQYTGLKDKNGVEIYEGDIVKDQHSYSDANIGKVWYRAELGSAVGWMVNGHYMSSMSSEIKIIGNIHQHPELLEQQ
jgi:uncharacterized phage protein (TIGR01671 family)